MKQVKITIPENTFTLTDAEINLIQAMAYYFVAIPESSGMTKEAYNLVSKMEKQFRHVGTENLFQVWE